MQAHEGESILSYLLSVPALGMTKPPSGGSQGAFTTPATNKQGQFWPENTILTKKVNQTKNYEINISDTKIIICTLNYIHNEYNHCAVAQLGTNDL